MPRYNCRVVMVSSEYRETWVEVEGDSVEEAKELALEEVEDGTHYWKYLDSETEDISVREVEEMKE